MLAWFAYLQAAPGLVVPHLRDELDIGYGVGGLHVAAFATGSLLAGLTAGALERRYGRRALLWGSAAVLALGTVGLTLGRVPAATVGALLVAGWGGAGLLITVQALLADHHGERRAIALTEANVAASVAYVVLVGGLSLAAAIGAGLARGAARVVRAAARAVVAQSRAPRSRRRRRRWRTPSRPAAAGVPGRGRDALLHGRRRVVHHRLGRELRRGRRGRLGRHRGRADVRLLRRRRGRAARSAAGSRAATPSGDCWRARWWSAPPASRCCGRRASTVTRLRRAGRDRPRARQPVPARARRVRRARAGPRAARERPRGDGGRAGGPARAADDRRAGRRDVADGGVRRRAR